MHGRDPHLPPPEGVAPLVHTVRALVHEHDGRLVAVVVGAPRDNALTVRDIERALAEIGIDFVDVRIRLDEGPLRLLSAEFER